MEIAIVHDELIRKGGAERVALCFLKVFPSAPLFTLTFNKDLTYPEFQEYEIITPWYGKLVKNEKWLKRTFFPFGHLAMKSIDLRSYDIILISSTHLAKNILAPNAIIINYCHTPFRLAWQPESYEEFSTSTGLIRLLFKVFVKKLRKIDFDFASKTDYFITNSRISKRRIIDFYRPKNTVKIINPPVDCSLYNFERLKDDYYLVVSRLEFYKKVDLVINAFNKLGEKLIIIGRGSKKEKLKHLANSNIIFLENIEQETLSKYYSKAKALIFPQYEDYGITPLEANASGTPVIAFGKGGILETMIPFTNESMRATAIFFKEQNVDSLIEAVARFESLKFDPDFIRDHALKFDESIFNVRIKDYVFQCFDKGKTPASLKYNHH